MHDKVFVDTNILVYAHDLDAGRRHDIAVSVVEALWENENGIVSTQVLQEFYVTVTKKITKPLSLTRTRGIVQNYVSWHVEINEPETIESFE
jgi:predicted nucleic acid-binding protein